MILHINGYFTQWSKKADILVINCVDKDRNLHRLTVIDECLRPRFYINESESETLGQMKAVMEGRVLSWNHHDVPNRFDSPVMCVKTKFAGDVVDARGFFLTHYQASIEWHKMTMIELGLWEWVDVDMGQVRYGICPVSALKSTKDPGWEWEGRTCWFDSEWDAGGLDHVPRPRDAINSRCIVIACINDVTEEGVIFTIHDKEKVASVTTSVTDTRLKTRIPDRVKTTKYVYTDEKSMIKGFIEWFAKQGFDTISGHNTSGGWVVTNNHGRSWRNGFDLPLLHERCKLLGVADSDLSPVGSVRERIEGERYELVIKGILLFDWLYAWKFSQYGKNQEKIVDGKKRRLRGNGLDELGKFYFDKGKARGSEELAMFYPGVKYDISRLPVWTLHSLFPDVADHYCLQDAILSWGLDRKHNVKHDILSVSYLVGAPPEDAMMASRYHKVYTYRLLKDRMVLESDLLAMAHPEVTDDDENGEDEKFGAFVPDAVRGIHDWILDLDFASMYPSIYQTFNAGVDTLIEPKEWTFRHGYPEILDTGGRVFACNELIFAPSGAIFRKKPDSVDKFIFRTLGSDRKAAKKQRDKCKEGSEEWIKWEGFQKRVKVAMNSRFGVAITSIFNTATLSGQYLLKSVISFLGASRVVGGDTDGLHVKLVGSARAEYVADARKIVNDVNSFIDSLVREEFGVEENFLKVEGDVISDRVLYHAKKMYMERVVWEKGEWLAKPKYDYRGFKIRRSDSSEAMDELFEHVRDLIFDATTESSGKASVEKYLREFHSKFPEKGPKEIAVSKSLSKYSDQYGNTFESRAANFTKVYMGKEYLPGETFYVASVSDYPNVINNKNVLPVYVTPKAAVAFDDDTTHFLDGMTIDIPDMERMTVGAIDVFTEFLNLNYNKVVSISGGLFR